MKSLSEKMTLEKYLRKVRGEPCRLLGHIYIYKGPGAGEGLAHVRSRVKPGWLSWTAWGENVRM